MHESAHTRIGAYIRVLNLGCGIRPGLGRDLVASLASRCRLSARVMNVDKSIKAIAKAEAAYSGGPSNLARDSHTSQQQECFEAWDATSEAPPPVLPPTLYSFGASTRYNLLIDNGSLDAYVGFTRSSDPLVAYLRSLRRCLLEPSLETSTPPLLLHFTADEARGDLMKAAFPSVEEAHADADGRDDEGGGRWRVDCDVIDVEAGERRTFFRWAVYRESG